MAEIRPFEPLDPIETALAELAEAERAGVFANTPLRSFAVESGAERHATRKIAALERHAARWFAAAAVLLLAAGVWGWMFRSNLAALRARSGVVGAPQLADAGAAPASLAHCLGGPAGSVDEACAGADFDGDGDVDLADVRSFQVAYAVSR